MTHKAKVVFLTTSLDQLVDEVDVIAIAAGLHLVVFVLIMMIIIFDTRWRNHILEIQQPGGIALTVDLVTCAFRMLHVDDELGWFGRVEDHAGVFRAFHLQTHEVVQRLGHAVAVGVTQEPHIAADVIAIGLILDHVDITKRVLGQIVR